MPPERNIRALASGGVHGCNGVLQGAHVMQPRGAAVKQVMHQANELLAPSLA